MDLKVNISPTSDYKAFQELLYNCELLCSWDITRVRSDREPTDECRAQSLRLWRDRHQNTIILLFYTSTRTWAQKTYIEEPSKQHFPRFHGLCHHLLWHL